jgi:hypothetical protein
MNDNRCRLCKESTEKTWPRLCSMCDHGVACMISFFMIVVLVVVAISA